MIEPIYRTGNTRDHIQYEDADWHGLQEFWNDLPLDNYMRDYGEYRRRRYSHIRYSQSMKKIDIVGTNTFLQSKQINPLNGDVVRKFEPVDINLLSNPIFVRLLEYFACISGTNTDEHRVNVHQHRITATGEEQGKPTPEGIHRDGVDRIAMLLISRTNIQGGASTLHDNNRRPIFTHTLAEPGDYIFLDDHTCLHSVSPVRVSPSCEVGYRDMLFFEFF